MYRFLNIHFALFFARLFLDLFEISQKFLSICHEKRLFCYAPNHLFWIFRSFLHWKIYFSWFIHAAINGNLTTQNELFFSQISRSFLLLCTHIYKKNVQFRIFLHLRVTSLNSNVQKFFLFICGKKWMWKRKKAKKISKLVRFAFRN